MLIYNTDKHIGNEGIMQMLDNNPDLVGKGFGFATTSIERTLDWGMAELREFGYEVEVRKGVISPEGEYLDNKFILFGKPQKKNYISPIFPFVSIKLSN